MAKKKALSVGVVLDESGSMGDRYEQTISGINEYVEGLKIEDDVVITLTMFSADAGDTHRTYCTNQKPEDFVPLTMETYRPRGNTPLYDAIGNTISEMETESSDKAVLVVIYTDGFENASREYNRETIFEMIQKKEKDGWRFLYLGVDQDEYAAAQAGAAMGMSAGSTMGVASADYVGTMTATTAATRQYVNSGGTMSSASVQDTIREEVNKTKEGGVLYQPPPPLPPKEEEKK